MVNIQLLNAVTEDDVKQSAMCWMGKTELFLSYETRHAAVGLK
jgi:hypothetical protein